jgi:hypothetical protein
MGFTTSSISDAVSALDERSKEIFRSIVESYLEHGEPLGSRSLSRLLPMSLSPASVRNVMSDLEELGLIYSPHISAGRLPTQVGLRFFVDAFMQVGDLSAEDRATIDRQVRGSNRDQPMETVMTKASGMLSGMSREELEAVYPRLVHARWQLECSKALLDGQPAPAEPTPGPLFPPPPPPPPGAAPVPSAPVLSTPHAQAPGSRTPRHSDHRPRLPGGQRLPSLRRQPSDDVWFRDRYGGPRRRTRGGERQVEVGPVAISMGDSADAGWATANHAGPAGQRSGKDNQRDQSGGTTSGVVLKKSNDVMDEIEIEQAIQDARRDQQLRNQCAGHTLREAHPAELSGDTLTLEFPPSAQFHLDLARDPKNANLLADALYDVTGRRLELVFGLGEAREAPAADEEPAGEERILELLKETFDARERES